MGIRGIIKQKLSAVWDKKYQRRLAAKKITYAKWLSAQVDSGDFSPQRDSAAGEVEITLIQVGEGVPAEDAKERLKAFFAANPQMLIAYGDEDVLEESGHRCDPRYKPDWSPDTFLNCFYWGNLVAVRTDWLEENGGLPEPKSRKDLMDTLGQLAVKAGGYDRGCGTIGHLPGILFHGAKTALREQYAGWGMEPPRRPQCESADACLVSVIIPSKDHPDLLFRNLNALFETKGEVRLQVIVTDNGSCEENRCRIEEFLEKAPVPCKYIYRPMEFNFSAMCNLGAKEADGVLLLFLNDDVEAASEGWLRAMSDKALLPYVGAVGLKLYYPGGDRIQHAGIVNLSGEPVHKLQFLPDGPTYYDAYNKKDRNVLAVTGACLMVQREKFWLAGGMKESLPVAYNDVELCFALWEQGFHNAVINSTFAYHHESLSRGADDSEKQRIRLAEERERLYALHPSLRGRDPYYSPYLSRDAWDSAIRPAYVTAGNRVQKAVAVAVTVDADRYRRDDCLLIGLEAAGQELIRGYSVVLGDDNACYEKTLLLWNCREQAEPTGRSSCLGILLEGQYRPDLEENMKDQTNVALGGFMIELEEPLPDGEYRLGILAVSRIFGGGLINWSRTLLKTDTGKGWN